MENAITIRNRDISSADPAYIIAEGGINHNGSLQTAKRLVDIALEAGVDAVKFQKRSLEETYVEEVVTNPATAEMGVEYTVSNLKDVQLTDAEFEELAEYARDEDIHFLCSPWDTTSVDFLESIDIPAYKVGSPDMTNFVLLERVLETGKPLILSTGMSEEQEIERTVEFLRERDAKFGLLHCRSTYPAPYHNLHLDYMDELDSRYGVPVGYSGHERGIAVSEAAVALGATVVERHFTLDRTMDGPDHAASLEPAGLEKLVRDIRNIESSRGHSVRYMTRGEYNNRVSLGKSLVTTEPIRAGETISREQVSAKSPAKGISPQYLYDIVGSTVQRDIDAGAFLQWDAIEDRLETEYDTTLDNWGIVVRHSDIEDTQWGNPDVYEFRVNGADMEVNIDDALGDATFEKRLGVHAPEQKGHDIVDLSAPNKETRTWAVDVTQRVVDITRDVFAPRFETDHEPQIVVHPGGITADYMERDSIPEMNKALERSISELDTDGVQLLLENMPPLPWIYGGQQYHNNFMDADEIAKFCDRTGTRLCYDTSHAKLWCNYNDEDLVAHAQTLRPYVDYLHVADAAGVDGEGLQIGEGEIDFERLAPVFADFDGPIVTEIWRGHEKSGEGFKKAAAELGRIFG